MSADADAAARAFGGSAPRQISARENAVYAVDFPTGRAALRLHRVGYQSEAAIRSELWWCDALFAAGVAVARPISTPGGDLVVRLPGGGLASAMGWVDGAPLGKAGVRLTGTAATQADLHRALGRLIAQVHAVTDALTLPDGFTRPRWNIDGLLGDAPLWGRFWEHPALTTDEAALARRTRDYLRERLQGHAATGALGLIHADVLRENVLVNDGSLSLIDFDDCGYGFRLYDLGTVLSQNLSEPALPAIAEALVDGYAQARAIDSEMVPVFTLMRCCASVGWTMPRLAPADPIHKSHIARAFGLAEQLLSGKRGW